MIRSGKLDFFNNLFVSIDKSQEQDNGRSCAYFFNLFKVKSRRQVYGI